MTIFCINLHVIYLVNWINLVDVKCGVNKLLVKPRMELVPGGKAGTFSPLSWDASRKKMIDVSAVDQMMSLFILVINQ